MKKAVITSSAKLCSKCDSSMVFSIIGAIIVIVGVYLLLWGKEGDAKVHIKPEDESSLTHEEQRDKKTAKISSAERNAYVLNCEP